MTTSTSELSPQRYALLGATGNTGRLILKRLLASPTPLEINIYVRSRSKLEALFPSLSSNASVRILEGSIHDRALIRDCLCGATTIICTVGENENIPGVRILRDCATAILDALVALKGTKHEYAQAQTPRPRLLLLSSATWNERFAAARPALLHWMIRNAFARPYSDLVLAQEMLAGASEFVDVLLVQPNALVKEPASGCVISSDFAYIAVSYEDLAEGFVRLASEPQYADVAATGVSSKRAESEMLYIPFVFGKVIRGLAFQFVPGFWQAEYASAAWSSGLRQLVWGTGKSKSA
ncbi:hypothetical protein BDW74DRAFT_179841 [Aspergillus multicolor]|uniref:uncharacterized protein n=1 Tax=Aspergillus multicolor TaxID=41759 RepID=UPI003CCCC4EB